MTTVVWGAPVVQFCEYVFTTGTFLEYTPLAGTSLTLQGSSTVGGFIFDASTHQTLAGDAARVTSPNTLSFYVWRTPANPSTQTLELGLVPEARPLDYSADLPPWERGEISLGTLTATDIAETPDLSLASMELDADADLLLRAWTGTSAWEGRVAISVRNTTDPAVRVIRLISQEDNPILLTTTQEDLLFSGLAGGPTGPRQRYVLDSRFGMPALNTELVRDGDNPGLWVRATDWDPDDPPARYRPRPGEGSVDDDIPS